MPKIFRQRDIEKMQASDVSREFVEYFNRLSEQRQKEFAESRPDLYSAVLVLENVNESEPVVEDTVEVADKSPADEKDNAEKSELIVKEDKEWQEIQKNVYENVDISRLIQTRFQPIVALTIINPEKCPAHHTYLKKYNPKFYKKNGSVMGVNFYHCKECNRLFIAKSEFESNESKMSEWDIPHTFYNAELSSRYLKTMMKPYELDDQETIYWVDPWIEDNPMCPVHQCSLEEIPCIVKYQEKSETFDAYYCEKCRKVILRKTRAMLLEDQFAQTGIPSDRFEQLIRKTPVKTAVPKKKVKPDYFLDEGKRSKYTFAQINNCYYLTEEDTVLVSDSRYCSLENHETQTVLGVIWVKEKSDNRRRSYMVLLGYCAECNKYYMDQSDYDTIYRTGRPEVKVIVDLDDKSYMISSGEVFNIESDHLKSMEDKIDCEIKEIHEKPDYVSQYETVSYYDDGDLFFKKERSRREYEPRLQELTSFKRQPYEYFVEISADGNKEKYYIGSSEIVLADKQEVIAVGSRLGRELVNYRTLKINKDNREYRINLSRQFDIDNGNLYGYTNLRTDEDVVFRQGITDPFLVRVLNMRRRQHELIDIFVTIQENQNAIVDADFKKNLVVQGCAGSGKTMVLLHRLSALKYTESNFDYSNDALILTPNDQFTLHINGLASSLQIDYIKRISVERYYEELLELYSSDLKTTGQIVSEMNVQQSFVNFIYSDDFLNGFKRNYKKIIKSRNQLISLVNKIAETLNITMTQIDTSNDSEVIPQLERVMSIIQTRININENEYAKASDELQKVKKQKERLAADIQKSGAEASRELKRAAQRIRTSVLGELTGRQKSIEEQKKQLSRAENSRENLIRRIGEINEYQDISFDGFASESPELIDEPVNQMLRTINEKRAVLESTEEEKNRIVELLNIPFEEIIVTPSVNDSEITGILTELSSTRSILEQLQQEKNRVENGWIFGRTRRLSRIVDRITETESLIDTFEKEIFELLKNRRIELEKNFALMDQLQLEIRNDLNETKKLITGNGEKRLDTLNRYISRLSQRIEDATKLLNQCVDVTYQLSDDMEDTEILSWFDNMVAITPGVADSLKPYRRITAENARYQAQYDGIDAAIEEAQAFYDQKLAERYSDEMLNSINDLKEKVAQYDVINTFQMIFDETVNPFMKAHQIRTINSKNHRYDLYARLIFACRFYGKLLGQSKFICIDEGQDIAFNEYSLIRKLNGNNVIFNIYGDTNQLMKPNRGITDWEDLKKLFSFEKYDLNENYRNTNQITRFCNDSFSMSVLQTGVDGPKVREISKAEFERELSNIQIGKNRIAVLLPRTIQKKTFILQSQINEEVKEAIGEKISIDNISVMYVDEVKGIEFDKVYVVSKDMGRNEKYIAYTRALNELILVVDDGVLLN